MSCRLRSTDNGQSWNPDTMKQVFDLTQTADQIAANGPQNYANEGPVDFTDKNVLVASGAVPAHFVVTAKPWVSISTDGGRCWRRPLLMPMSGLHSLSGQASTMVREDGMSLVALTSVTPDGWTRRPLVYASPDGVQWNFLCFMTPEDDDGQAVSDKVGVPALRRASLFLSASATAQGRPDHRQHAVPARSRPAFCGPRCSRARMAAARWRFLSRVNDWGAPGDIVAARATAASSAFMAIALRPTASAIASARTAAGPGARRSSCATTAEAGIVGYPRVIEHEPNKCLAVYYFNRKDDHDPGQWRRVATSRSRCSRRNKRHNERGGQR